MTLVIIIILIFISYVTDVYQFFAVSTYGVTALDFTILAFYLYFLKRIIWDGDKFEFSKQSFHFFFIAFLAALVISGLTPLVKASTVQIIQFLKTTIHIIFIGFFTFVCAFYKINYKVWTAAVKTWLMVSLFINVFGIYQLFARAYDLPLAWLKFTNVSLLPEGSERVSQIKQFSLRYGAFFRATSIMTEPSALASYNLVTLSFIIAPYVQKMKPFFKSKIFTVILFVISLITLFLCFSLTGFIGLVMIAGIVLLFNKSGAFKPFLIGVISSALIIFVADAVVENYTGTSVVKLFSKRVSGLLLGGQGTYGESYSVRVYSAKMGIDIWEEHPINGAGLGLTAYNNDEGVKFSDSSAVTVLSETGIIGFFIFCGLFASLFIVTGRILVNIFTMKNLPEDLRKLGATAFYIVSFLFLINFVSGNNLVSYVTWIFFGFVVSVINQIRLRNFPEKAASIKIAPRPLKYAFSERISNYLKLASKK